MDIQDILQRFAHLPKLPDGRIDYAQSDSAPVLVCFVFFEGKLVLLKRSSQVRAYQGKWCAVAGYIDEPRSLTDKAAREIEQELGLKREEIDQFAIGEPYEFRDPELNKLWCIHPIAAVLKRASEVAIDWEHADFEWIEPAQLSDFDTVPKLDESLRRALAALPH